MQNEDKDGLESPNNPPPLQEEQKTLLSIVSEGKSLQAFLEFLNEAGANDLSAKQKAFLACLYKMDSYGATRDAMGRVGIALSTVSLWRKNPVFAECMDMVELGVVWRYTSEMQDKLYKDATQSPQEFYQHLDWELLDDSEKQKALVSFHSHQQKAVIYLYEKMQGRRNEILLQQQQRLVSSSQGQDITIGSPVPDGNPEII